MTYQKISSPYVTTTDPTTRTDSAPTNTRPVLLTAVAAVRGPQYAGMAYQRGRTIGHQPTLQREHAGEMLGHAVDVVCATQNRLASTGLRGEDSHLVFFCRWDRNFRRRPRRARLGRIHMKETVSQIAQKRCAETNQHELEAGLAPVADIRSGLIDANAEERQPTDKHGDRDSLW